MRPLFLTTLVLHPLVALVASLVTDYTDSSNKNNTCPAITLELFVICRQLGFAKGGAVTSFKGRGEVGVEKVSVSSSLSSLPSFQFISNLNWYPRIIFR